MNYVRKTYVEFLYPGLMVSESSTKEVENRDVTKLLVPDNAFGFKFFDILSVTVEADGQKMDLISQRLNISPMHYYGGTVYTVAELKANFAHEPTLISNVEDNGYKRAIRCRTGNWRPLDETDIYISEAA